MGSSALPYHQSNTDKVIKTGELEGHPGFRMVQSEICSALNISKL